MFLSLEEEGMLAVMLANDWPQRVTSPSFWMI
jgi:hypothetical protein